MPYKSLAQMRYLHSQHPDIAARWDKEQKASGKAFPHADVDFQKVRDDLEGIQPRSPSSQPPRYDQPGQKRQRGELDSHRWTVYAGNDQPSTGGGGAREKFNDLDLQGRGGNAFGAYNDMDITGHVHNYSLTGKTPIDKAAETFDAHTYRYKSPHDEPRSQPNGGVYGGIIAQHLLKDPIAGQAVTHTPNGLKVELGPQVSTLSAIAGRHNERIGTIEHHLTGLMHAHRHMQHQLSDRDTMLQKLHEVLSRKIG